MSDADPRLIGTSNPDSSNHWLKKKYLDRAQVHLTRAGHVEHLDSDLDLARLTFNIDDNPTLRPSYIQQRKAEYAATPLLYKRLILGEWCIAEGAVYEVFDEQRHVVDIVPEIVEWLGVGLDYGTSNATAALLVGLGSDGCLYVTNEWRHDGRTQGAISDGQISQRLQRWLRTLTVPGHRDMGVEAPPLIIDPSAASLRTQLRDDDVSFKRAHNKVLSGIRIVANLLAADKLRIHRGCTGLLDEMASYVWDPKASLLGEDRPLKQDDHGCLIAGTPVLTDQGEQPIEAVQQGSKVLTRAGWKTVTDAGMTAAAAQVYRVDLSNGTAVTGTGNHPVWVEGSGWTRLDSLRYDDKLVAWRSASTPSSSTASSSAATQTRPAYPSGATTSPESLTADGASDASTKRSGRPPTGETYPRATTSTTPTGTTSTTTRTTSPASPQTSTSPTMASSHVPQPSRPPGRCTGRALPSGTGQTPAALGTSNTAPALGTTGNHTSGTATSAAARTTPGRSVAMNGFARTPASPHGAELLGSTTKTAPASSAVPFSASTATAALATADVRVLRVTAMPERVPVWNLTVADCPEYFASGVLVHNCDALRYVIKTTQNLWRSYVELDFEEAEEAA
jgi:PBSX family phage terminase large subunit